jgi:CRP-like cAMP-binding protein
MRNPTNTAMSSLAARRLLILSLLLTMVAMLLALQFVYNTTGGTLFLFTTVTPLLVIASILILLGVLIHEYRQMHMLFKIERYRTDCTIFKQGDIGHCAYFIRDGEVKVIREEDGAVLATRGKGEYFGEMALISNSPRNATVRTITPVELAVLGKRNFLEMMKLIPETEEAILNCVKERAMEATKR